MFSATLLNVQAKEIAVDKTFYVSNFKKTRKINEHFHVTI